MEQRTDDWLEWRRQGIGGSDAAAVLGISPWVTRFQLWEDKTRRSKPKPTNWAMERGTAVEPVARAWYELKTGLEMRTELAVHSQFSFMRTSLDGINVSAKRALEIKHTGKADHEKAKEGKVPEKYFPQVQHILIVTGMESLDYLSYQSQDDAVILNVKPDLEWCRMYFHEAIKFWDLVTSDTPPDLSDDDFKKMPKEVESLIQDWRVAKVVEEEATKQVDEARLKILATLGDAPRFKGYGISVNTIYKKGTIDYAKAGKELKIDFEPYRKKSITSVEFRQLKEEK